MKRIRKIVATIVLAAFMTCVTGPAHAGGLLSLPGTEEALLSTLVSLQSKIFTHEVMAAYPQLVEAVRVAADSFRMLNEIAGVARTAYRLQQAVRSYTVDKLMNDLSDGIMDEFKEIKDLQSEYSEFKSGVDMLRNGQTDQYFATRSRWDRRTLTFVDDYIENYEKSNVFTIIAPRSAADYGWKPSSLDRLYYSALAESGLTDDFKSKVFQRKTMDYYAKAFDQDARENQNLQAQIESKMYENQINQSTSLDTIATKAKVDLVNEQDHKNIILLKQTTGFHVYEQEKLKARKIGDFFKPGAQPDIAPSK